MKFCEEVFLSVHEEKMSMMMESMVHIDKAPLRVLDLLIEEGIVLFDCADK